MVDFSKLLRKPAGEAKRPPVLPAGDYQGIIKAFELGDANRNKTPYCRFQVGLIGWGEGTPETWTVFDPASGKTYDVSQADIDLSKRQMRRDYYLTEDALFRLDELIRSCGVEPAGRTYEEILPEMIGQQVLVEIQQYTNQTTAELGNQIGKIVGASH
jgi:hypothetical protein